MTEEKQPMTYGGRIPMGGVRLSREERKEFKAYTRGYSLYIYGYNIVPPSQYGEGGKVPNYKPVRRIQKP